MGNPGDSYASGDQPGSQFSATGNFVIDFDSDGPHATEAIRLAHPDATGIEMQPGGRFSTVGALIDHVFLVERRHLQRLRGTELDTRTGLSGLNAPPLFDYGAALTVDVETAEI